MKKNLTELVFIVDCSGSMAGLETDTIGGFNATLDAHRAAEGEAVVSTVLFNHETKVLHDRLPIAEVPSLGACDYQVGGCTALLDAVGGAIKHIGRVQGYLPEDYRPEHTIVVITTDGYENSSRKYAYDQVKRMVEQKKEQGWEFLFLGADIDAVGEAARIGIGQDRAVMNLADSEGQRVAYEAVASATCAIRGARPGSAPMGAAWKAPVERDCAKRGASRRGRRR